MINYKVDFSKSNGYTFFCIILIERHLDLPTPQKISFWWNYGSLLGLFLGVQILSGIFLACNYVTSFESVDLIMRDIWMGWVIRLIHAKGASIFFLFLYLHLCRGIYYFNYLRNQNTWLVGVVILIIRMATAFLGYVLPWGNMSYWGATVITNLVSVIPIIGDSVVQWLWGGFAVKFFTLTRFFAFHYVCPFIIAFFIVVHVLFLHVKGSRNPLGLLSNNDKIVFLPYFGVKDLLGFIISFILLFVLVLIYPYFFMDCDKFIEANALVTPIHIQPEWYFLPAYAVLRSIPKKLGGVIGLLFFYAILFFIPFLNEKYKNFWKIIFFLLLGLFFVRHSNIVVVGFIFFVLFAVNDSYEGILLYYFNKCLFWVWIAIIFCLLWIGAKPVEDPYIWIGELNTILYFLFYFLWEKKNWCILSKAR